jgi:hypothetical protein
VQVSAAMSAVIERMSFQQTFRCLSASSDNGSKPDLRLSALSFRPSRLTDVDPAPSGNMRTGAAAPEQAILKEIAPARLLRKSSLQIQFVVSLLDLHRTFLQVCRDNGLGPPAQVLRQESFRDRIKREIVLWPDEAMAFIGKEQINGRNRFRLESFNHLI